MKVEHDPMPKEGVGIPVPATLASQKKTRLSRTRRALLTVALLSIWAVSFVLKKRGLLTTQLSPEEAFVPWPILAGGALGDPEAFKRHHGHHGHHGRRHRILNGKAAEKIFQ